MRCYLRYRGHFVEAAPLLNTGEDTDAISQAQTLFRDRLKDGRELSGFEVWEDDRPVYRCIDGNEELRTDAVAPSTEQLRSG